MKGYNSNINYIYNNNDDTKLTSSNLKQGVLYNKNNMDLNIQTQPENSSKSIVKTILQLFSNNTNNNTESFIGSVSQIPLDIPILGESGSQVNTVNGLNRSNSLTKDTDGATTVSEQESQASSTAQQNIQLKYNEFNQLLGQYTAQYKKMTEELILNNNKNILQKYSNSNIKLNNDFYYVNEYGFAHKYEGTDNPTTGTISASCKGIKDPIQITTLEFNKLLSGSKMGANQACGVAGYNVENSANGEKSFIDIEGVKHIYSGEVWNQKHESCNIDKKSITDDEYKNIPSGNAMSKTTFCATINVDPLVLEKLLSLNKQIQTLGNTIITEINALTTTQTTTDNNVNFIKKSITDKLDQLNKSQEDIITLGDEYNSTGSLGLATDSSNTIKARTRDSQIVVNMNYLKYIIGFILVVFLMITTFYVFSYEISSPFLILVLIILIILVMVNFFNFMYNKLYHKFLNKILLYS